MKKDNQAYWIQLLDRLNTAEDIDSISEEILEELCRYFQFGMGFIYEADYKGDFHLTKTFQNYINELPETFGRYEAFTPEDERSILDAKTICFRGGVFANAAEEKLARLLGGMSMVLVPVRGQQEDLIAMVGILDRRGKVRYQDEDIPFTTAVLTTLGTYIKMKIYQNRIRSTQESLEKVLNHMGVDVYVNDFETHEILYMNQSMAAPYGGVENTLGKVCWQALYEDKTEECEFCPKPRLLDEDGKPTRIYGWDYQRPFDGSWFRVLSAAFPWVDGRTAQVVSSIDITENKTNEEIIRRAAEYDTLTFLPNRARLSTDLDAKLARMEESGKSAYVLFFDLDGFKPVNDTLGHEVGDELLAAVGAYLQASPLTRDRSYRYGGDEFVVLWDDDCPGTLDDMLAYLRAGFSTPWQLKKHEVRCGASIGISQFPSDGALSSRLVRNADLAMYESKRAGTGAVHTYNQGKPALMEKYIPGDVISR